MYKNYINTEENTEDCFLNLNILDAFLNKT